MKVIPRNALGFTRNALGFTRNALRFTNASRSMTTSRPKKSFTPEFRACLDQWTQRIKGERWEFLDNFSLGPTVNFRSALKLVFPHLQSAPINHSSSGIPIGHHFFYNNQPNTELGPDGYDNYQAPRALATGVSLFKRRMWVNGHIVYHQHHSTIPVSQPTKCTETVKSVRVVETSVFVTINRAFTNAATGEPILNESRCLVYTNEPYNAPAKSKLTSLVTDHHSDVTVPFSLSYADVKRFCALSYNVHRIHYDVEYCQHTENLSDVIVPGPLMASILLQVFSSTVPNCKVASIKYKNAAPCYVNTNLHVVIKPSCDNTHRLVIADLLSKDVFIDAVIVTC